MILLNVSIGQMYKIGEKRFIRVSLAHSLELDDIAEPVGWVSNSTQLIAHDIEAEVEMLMPLSDVVNLLSDDLKRTIATMPDVERKNLVRAVMSGYF